MLRRLFDRSQLVADIAVPRRLSEAADSGYSARHERAAQLRSPNRGLFQEKHARKKWSAPRPALRSVGDSGRGGGLVALVGGLLSVLLSAGSAQVQPAAPPLASARAPLVLRGVTVIDVREGRRLPDQTVVVVGNRIRTIESAASARAPKGARVVEAQGKYLIPGVWEMHMHTGAVRGMPALSIRS